MGATSSAQTPKNTPYSSSGNKIIRGPPPNLLDRSRYYDRRPVDWVLLLSAPEVERIFQGDDSKALADALGEDTINVRKYVSYDGGSYCPPYFAVKFNSQKCTESLIKLNPNLANYATNSRDTTTMYEMALNSWPASRDVLLLLQLQQMKIHYEKIRLFFVSDKKSYLGNLVGDLKMLLLEIFLFYVSVSPRHIEQQVRAARIMPSKQPLALVPPPRQPQLLQPPQPFQQPQPPSGLSMMYASQASAFEAREKPVTKMYASQSVAYDAKEKVTVGIDMEAAAKRKRDVVEKLPTNCKHCNSPLTPAMTVELRTGEIISYCRSKDGCAKSHIIYAPPDLTGLLLPPTWPKWEETQKTWVYISSRGY